MAAAPIKPQLAWDAQGDFSIIPTNGEWVIEPKLDGWRWQVHRTADGVVSIGGRNGKQHSEPRVEAELVGLPVGTVLDGEMVWEGNLLGSYSVKQASFVAFDVLALAGADTCARPWHERRRLLEALVAAIDSPLVVLSPISEVDQAVHDAWLEQGFEGSVAKRKDAPYRPGTRRRDGFVKVKPQATAEALVGGWEYGKGASNKDRCGALQITLVDTGAETTCGYDCTVNEAMKMVGRLIEIKHHGWNPASGKVRHPVFSRTREDLEGDPEQDPAVQRVTRAVDAVRKEFKPDLTKPVVASARPGAWLRNYRAMGEAKLRRCIAELETGEGDAVDRVKANDGDVEANLNAAKSALEAKAVAA
jgi:hypothetical protein